MKHFWKRLSMENSISLKGLKRPYTKSSKIAGLSMTFSHNSHGRPQDFIRRLKQDDAVHGKFVSGAKVLAAVPSISLPRRVYEDRLETGGAGKELSTNNDIDSRNCGT